ncbi:hypothetical protein Micbo1qcDRAFT_230003 [Microdochium bolleyi]|uniref:Uncharacterized protein n=1 Tax=Microdochium bolleyi TaxID=196109 RepID=A0A136JJH7_9PEZI|nr:hypothetical protein Micbo1qcDRAFT_230003 [Microdochium bolleyi]
MSTPTNVLITGASRGLGKGFLQRYLLKPNHTVIAANRDPSGASSAALAELPRAQGSRLILVKLDADAETDAQAAVAELRASHGIEHLDIVIANAGIAYVYPTVADLRIADLEAHMRTNLHGLVRVYQATRPLLRNSSLSPVFAPVGSSVGSISKQLSVPNAAYAPTKAAAGWMTSRIALEDGDWLTCFALVPGLVETDLGRAGIEGLGLTMEAAAEWLVDFDVSVDGMVAVMDGAAKDKARIGGKMVSHEGEILPW